MSKYLHYLHQEKRALLRLICSKVVEQTCDSLLSDLQLSEHFFTVFGDEDIDTLKLEISHIIIGKPKAIQNFEDTHFLHCVPLLLAKNYWVVLSPNGKVLLEFQISSDGTSIGGVTSPTHLMT